MSPRQRVTLLAAICGPAVATIDGAVVNVAFFLSRRAGVLADRFGPRDFLGVGPLLAAAGIGVAVVGAVVTSTLRGDAFAGGRLVGAPQASLPQQA